MSAIEARRERVAIGAAAAHQRLARSRHEGTLTCPTCAPEYLTRGQLPPSLQSFDATDGLPENPGANFPVGQYTE